MISAPRSWVISCNLSLSKIGPNLSYLFFADDLIILNKADLVQANLIKGVLERFCAYSSHSMNAYKTNIYFSYCVDETLSTRISNWLGFQKVNDLGIYLGIHLQHGRVKKGTLRFVVEMVRNKLSSWNAKQLSLIGKLTLA